MTRFADKLWWLTLAAALLILLVAAPALAGEPDKTVGGIDVNHYVCAAADHKFIDLDSDAFTDNGDGTATFDKTKQVDLQKLKGECKEAEDDENENFTVEPIQQTRIEGIVFEFHVDPAGPGGWRGVRSRDVPVVVSGPGFEVVLGSDKDGTFFLNNLGAGPVTFNLRLPGDAHPINPNLTVVTNGFSTITSGVYLAFYRGDMPPPDPAGIQAPDGLPIPPANFTFDQEMTSGTNTLTDLTSMPSVGGVLPPTNSIYVIVLALVVLVVLPLAGVVKLRRSRPEN